MLTRDLSHRGRHISTVFEQLPDAVSICSVNCWIHPLIAAQKEFPDYYDEIKLPISLETIEVRPILLDIVETLC